MEKPAQARTFYRYVLPAMASQLLTGFFIIVDGLFIGIALGDDGLAAVNLLWPVPAVVMAVGLGIGAGGAVALATALGARDLARAGRARGNTLLCLLAAAALLTAVLSPLVPAALRWLGAQGRLYPLAEAYLRVAAALCAAQVLNCGLNPLLRAEGKTLAAMGAMIAGLLTNLALDWLFILRFGWGTAGAAWATVLAQGLCALAQLVCLAARPFAPFARGQFVPRRTLCRSILLVGLSPFGLSVSASVVILLNNWQAMRYGGESGVAVYAILSYAVSSMQPLLTGIGEGVQPLVSYCSGAGDLGGRCALLQRALRLLALTCCVLCTAALALRGRIPSLFGASAATAQRSAEALVWAVCALPLWGVVRLFSSYFYAVGKSRRSLALIYGTALAAQPLCLYALPLRMGLSGVWAAELCAQLLMVLVLCAMLRRARVGEESPC